MNKKGFVLVETIISSVFVLGILVFITANVLPIIGEYEKANEYDTIDAIYDTHLIRKMIYKEPDVERIRALLQLDPHYGKNYYVFDKDTICNFLTNQNYCRTLLSRDYLDVKEIVITKYEIKDTFVKASKKFDRGMREYIAQMQKYSRDPIDQHCYTARMIVYYNDGRITNVEMIHDGWGYWNLTGGLVC